MEIREPFYDSMDVKKPWTISEQLLSFKYCWPLWYNCLERVRQTLKNVAGFVISWPEGERIEYAAMVFNLKEVFRMV